MKAVNLGFTNFQSRKTLQDGVLGQATKREFVEVVIHLG